MEEQENTEYVVILFYKFVDIADPKALVVSQKELCAGLGLKGRLLIAEEGVNGTFEGTKENIERYKEEMGSIIPGIVFKESRGTGKAFTRLEIKVRKEVVTLGAGRFDVAKETGKEITAEELEALYDTEQDFVLLDLRNDFELKVGQFEGTINDKIGFALQNFRDLPNKMKELASFKEKKVVTVCTGDIRCEKATCLLKREGFKDVYHLKDGIHTYMQRYPGKRFRGSLFVFDNRMTTEVAENTEGKIEREVIGRCEYCKVDCEEFYSDDTLRPSKKVIACNECAETYKDKLRRCRPTLD